MLSFNELKAGISTLPLGELEEIKHTIEKQISEEYSKLAAEIDRQHIATCHERIQLLEAGEMTVSPFDEVMKRLFGKAS